MLKWLFGWSVFALLVWGLVEWLGTPAAALVLAVLAAATADKHHRALDHLNAKINAERERTEKLESALWKLGDRLGTRIERIEDRR